MSEIKIDTSTAAVQRLAKYMAHIAETSGLPDSAFGTTAATLTALAGERDAAVADVSARVAAARLAEAEARGRRAGIAEAAKVADVAADLASPSDFQSNLNTALALAAAIRALTEPQA